MFRLESFNRYGIIPLIGGIMKPFLLALAVSSMLVGVAHAEDRPLFGPAPPWVKAVVAPNVRETNDSPVRVLLSDQQIMLDRSVQTVFSQLAFKIQTPQGLAIGNVSLPWRPETDRLTVHKLLIRRGEQVIDVLASGQTFTVVRREANLEQAMLDGILTANIQPEGLQVGDILELTTSLTSSDPVLKGHAEQIAGAWNGFPIDRAHLRVQWPASLAMRMRQTQNLPPLRPSKVGDTVSIELTMDKVEPVSPPKGAPPRYGQGRLVEFTDFSSWEDVGALMAPLYDSASTLPADGPLRAEVEKIRMLSTDPKVRAEATLALVQDRIRYVALTMGTGGYVPADAGTTWSRRYGDCKGKTALLLAILKALDIAAEPVAVSTALGDGLDARLPLIGLFNHVLVRAKIGGRDYWLDGTRLGDTSLDRLVTPAFGWGLPLTSTDAQLIRMVATPLEKPGSDVSIKIDARAGLSVPAPTQAEIIYRGDQAIGTNLAIANLTGEARDRALRDFWRERYDFIDVTAASSSFDPKSGELRLVMDGLARMEWNDGWYETDGTGVGYKADFSRDPGPDRDAPFAVGHPFFNRTKQTIFLPPGFSKANISPTDAGVEETVAGVEYSRRATMAGDVFAIEATERSIADEFPAKDAEAAQVRLRALRDKTVYLRKPNAYRLTEQEMKAARAEVPTTVKEFLSRGYQLLERSEFEDAIQDFSRALELEPTNADALSNRGLAYVWTDAFDDAAKDLDAAEKLAPRHIVAASARGLMAERQGFSKQAIAAYSKALDIQPDNAFVLGHRALVHASAGHSAEALADAAQTLSLNPQWVEMRILRARIFRETGRETEGVAEAAAAVAVNPGDAGAYTAAGRIYGMLGMKDEALRAFDRAIEIKPDAYTYALRSDSRPEADLAERRADIEAALQLNPRLGWAWRQKIDLLVDAKDLASAVAAVEAGARGESPILNSDTLGWGARLRQALKAAGDTALRARLLEVLSSEPYRAAGIPDLPDVIRLEYAEILVKTGDVNQARTTIAGLKDSGMIARMMLDPELRSVRPDTVDVRAAVEEELAGYRKAIAENAKQLKPIVAASDSLQLLGRPAEALALLQGVASRLDEEGAFTDVAQYKPWWWNSLALSYRDLNKYEEMVAAFRQGMQAKEGQMPNVSQVINLASYQLEFNRYDDALDSLSIIEDEGRSVTPYGLSLVHEVRGCARALSGKTKEAAENLAYLTAHSDDAPSSLTSLLLCINDMDGAAKILIGRLNDPNRRVEALLDVSEFDDPPVALPLHPADERFKALKLRPDVQKAIQDAGGTYRFNVQQKL